MWNKIGTGNGSTLGHNYGTIGPDLWHPWAAWPAPAFC